jgi:hypothetical protein
MRPRSKFDRLVLSEAGLTVINEAETAPALSDLARARWARNGLMVALLAFCPVRLKNFAALEVGRSFVQVKQNWFLDFATAMLARDLDGALALLGGE